MKYARVLLIVSVLIISAVAFSLLLLPRTPELALIQMKDKRFEEALESYEKQREAGVLNAEVVSNLTELYLQQSEVEKAIDVMEAFVAANPKDLEARKRLGIYYQYAQRTDDYLRNLEEINRLTPTPENLKTLADIYNFKNEHEQQAQTLKEIVATDPESSPQSYLDLANIQAADGKHDEAIATLQQFKAQQPEQFSYDAALLLISLMLDKNQEADALQVATDWQAANPKEYEDGAQLVNMLHYKGSVESAKMLLGQYSSEEISKSPDLLQEKILLQIVEGNEEGVYKELQQLHASGNMAPVLKERLLYLALIRDDAQTATTVLDDMDLRALSEPQLNVLAELAMFRDHRPLLNRLYSDFSGDSAEQTHPVLTTILSVIRRDEDIDAKLNALAQQEISSDAAIQVARTCVRRGKQDCVRTYLSKLPQPEDASDTDIAAAAEIYIEGRQWENADALLGSVPDRNSSPLRTARLKLAAATGDEPTVDNWLNNDSEKTSPRLMADMFFLALNNDHLDMASVIGERFHAQENSALSRSALSQVYIKTGQYEEAIKLLRGTAPRTQGDEANYLFALAKLSGSSEKYRRELAGYASERLRSDMPHKEKMALVYALITAKQVEPAMPYIRELALSEGGSWASLYAETLDKQGRHQESREFWVKYAEQSSTSRKDKLAVAYTLLGNGYKKDAEQIFAGLAAGAPAESTEVKGLVYMWGSRPEPANLEWVASRMRAAQGEERARWAKLLSDITSDETIIWLAQKDINNLASPALVRRYTDALARNGQLDEQYPVMEDLARNQGRTDLLRHYAAATRDAGFYRISSTAYDTLFELGQGNTVLMREAATSAYNRSDYSETTEYLNRYLEAPSEERVQDPRAYEAYFMYGELLRREDEAEAMVPYYQASLDALEATPHNKTAEIMSRKAQSLIWTGKTDEGLALFQETIQRFPNNDILRADYANTLIEVRRYAEARETLETPLQSQFGALRNPVNETLNPSLVSQYKLLNDNSELVLYVPAGERTVVQISERFKTMRGISYASEGYDTLLLGAAPGSKFDIQNDASGLQIRTVPGYSRLEMQSEVQTVLRYELLKARTDLETGEIYAATDRLNGILQEHENDPQLLGFTANAENYGGNWSRAQTLLRHARTLAPKNEDIIELDDAIRRQYAPGAKLDFEWLSRGNDHEYITSLSGYGYANDNLQIGWIVQNNRILATNERRADGRVGNFDGHRQRGELYGIYAWENGNYLRGSLFANNDTLGAGARYHFLNSLGETELIAEYHRPYWEFTASILDDTTRDYVGIAHTIKPLPEFSLTINPGYARYNTDVSNNVYSAATVQMAAVYRLIDQQPFLALSYGIDAEYETSHKKGFDSLGNFSQLAPMRSREIHFFAVNAGYDFTERTYGDVILGYGFDRLGGHGPSIEGRLTHEITEAFDAQIRASYGLDSGQSDDNLTRLGAYIRWKY